jgi:hypothetical protein
LVIDVEPHCGVFPVFPPQVGKIDDIAFGQARIEQGRFLVTGVTEAILVAILLGRIVDLRAVIDIGIDFIVIVITPILTGANGPNAQK